MSPLAFSGTLAPIGTRLDNFRFSQDVDYERFFLEQRRVIADVVRAVGRRHGLTREETDDLQGAVNLKIIENDYEVLRKFEQRSSFKTYILTVVQRHFLDERTARWGKWRPSMQALRLGPAAVELDRLLTRDGRTFDEAVEIIRATHSTLSRDALSDMAAQLPPRTGRHFVSPELLEELPSREVLQDVQADRAKRGALVDLIERTLIATLQALEPQDRLILKLIFRDNLPISKVAHLLGIEQKPLYRRKERLFSRLRSDLVAAGVDREAVPPLLGGSEVDFGEAL